MQVSNFSLDWLSFTFKRSDCPDLLASFWEVFPELVHYKHEMFIVGGRNFAHGLCLDDYLTIRYDDDANSKGINVEIPSHGLENAFKLFQVKTVKEMFELLEKRSCMPSRIDICFDDFTKSYKPSYYYKKFLNGCLVTKMRTVKMVHSGDGKGETFYLGDRRKKMLRIYDKSVESGGEIDAIRYELELHANSAKAFFVHVIDSKESEISVFGDCLLDVLDIRRKSDDKNITRWEKNKKWYAFIKSTLLQSSFTIPSYKPDQLIENIEKHVENNYSAFTMMIALHGLQSVLKALAECGLNERHRALLRKTALDRGLHPDFYIASCLLLNKKGA